MQQISVIENHEVAEVTKKVWQVSLQFRFPNGLPRTLGDEEGNAFTIILNKPLYQH